MNIFPALALVISVQAAPGAAQVDATTRPLFAAFASMDAGALKDHFADAVRFIGDPRFLGETGREQVVRDLKRDDLVAAYARMFSAMDKDRWAGLIKQLTPSLSRATSPGSHPEDTTGLLPSDFVKTGEYLYQLKAPGTGLDDVILFVLRLVDGKWRVVAHWADY